MKYSFQRQHRQYSIVVRNQTAGLLYSRARLDHFRCGYKLSHCGYPKSKKNRFCNPSQYGSEFGGYDE